MRRKIVVFIVYFAVMFWVYESMREAAKLPEHSVSLENPLLAPVVSGIAAYAAAWLFSLAWQFPSYVRSKQSRRRQKRFRGTARHHT